MEMKGKKVLVFGSGISGEAAARLLLREGAQVILYDGNEDLRADKIMKKITDKLPDGEKLCQEPYRKLLQEPRQKLFGFRLSLADFRKNFLNSFP